MSESIQQLPDGRFAVRFERVLHHRRERVWAALTEVEQLRRWFVEILDYNESDLNFGVGGSLTYVASGQVVGRGTVTEFEPPALLEFTWDAEVLRWELADLDDDCRLQFVTIVDSQETASAVAEGWSSGLDKLATLLIGADDAHA